MFNAFQIDCGGRGGEPRILCQHLLGDVDERHHVSVDQEPEVHLLDPHDDSRSNTEPLRADNWKTFQIGLTYLNPSYPCI